ncbi:myosin-6, putative [Entamoeba invadens IP1]|uniref:Myosin-6, putative n=1 Tax=Entamoeba invadens IP1 TaxID=370355 RepID=L7FNR3_ENTIV|nr:myosin-6, putative [Entamoeba invadens IP1]ELP92409.1 myosin-6, putative [Entamoeba invadens IP1]|eukprot:XP_004259180.1 myosin-6, putative [Entamoeba invadens IP1]
MTASGVTSDAIPVVKDLMKQICEKYKKDGKPRVYTVEFRFGKIKIFFKVGVLAEIEEIRENRVTELVGGLHMCAKAFAQRKLIEQKRNEHIAITAMKTPFTLGTNSEIGRRFDEELAAKDKEIETVKKKLAEEIAKREAAEKALSEMKIKNVDLEALVQEFKKDIESKKIALDKADMKSRKDQKHIEELQGNIKRGMEDLSKLTNEYKKLEADNQRLQDEITEHKATIAKKDCVITELNKDIEDEEGEISDLKKKLVAEGDNSKDLETQLRMKRDNKIVDLEKAVAALKDQNTQLDAAKKDIKKWSVEDASKIENNKSHIKALEVQKKMALDDKAEAEKTTAD